MTDPKIAQKGPYVMELDAGKYFWCACGHSANQPFCDGAHVREAPGIEPLEFELTEKKQVALCGCKQTGTPPFCDGTHTKLP